MTSSSSSIASPPALAAKTGVRHATAMLAIILVSYFMILLDNSIIFTALPKIEAAMRFSPAGLAWGAGRLHARLRRPALARRAGRCPAGWPPGLCLRAGGFALASLLVGLAPAGWWLITARGVQGTGAAIVAPSSLSLLTATFAEGRGRAKAVALYGATAGIGASPPDRVWPRPPP
jgi:MFS family permease